MCVYCVYLLLCKRDFSSLLEENKHNPKCLFNKVAKLTKTKASAGVDISQQHSNNDFMTRFTSNIDNIRDQMSV